MALVVGSHLGHNVTVLIGEGGIGQVYESINTKLSRQVAPGLLEFLFVAALLALTGCGGPESEAPVAAGEPDTQDAQSALIARAAELELDTEYTPPPGEALHHHTAGFARTLCSAVFLTGLDPEDAAANIGGFTSPFEERRHVVDTVVDFERQSVSLTLPDGVTRVATRYNDQGCVALPIGEDSVYFTSHRCAAEFAPVQDDALAHGRRAAPTSLGQLKWT